jgi:L,D-transpeptidase YcbB
MSRRILPVGRLLPVLLLLKEKRPVRISYFTAWVDGEGLLNFREDVYGHDERLARELFR